MSDLLLTHGYFLADDEKERQIMKPYPPLGILYLSAYLKRAGFSVDVFDSTFAERAALTERFAATPGELQADRERISHAAHMGPCRRLDSPRRPSARNRGPGSSRWWRPRCSRS